MATAQEINDLFKTRHESMAAEIERLKNLCDSIKAVQAAQLATNYSKLPEWVEIGNDEDAAFYALTQAYAALSLKDKEKLDKKLKQIRSENTDQDLEVLKIIDNNLINKQDNRFALKPLPLAMRKTAHILGDGTPVVALLGFFSGAMLAFAGGIFIAIGALLAIAAVGFFIGGAMSINDTVYDIKNETQRNKNCLQRKIDSQKRGMVSRFPWQIAPDLYTNFKKIYETTILRQASLKMAVAYTGSKDSLLPLTDVEKRLADKIVERENSQQHADFIKTVLENSKATEIELNSHWQTTPSAQLQQTIVEKINKEGTALLRRQAADANAELRATLSQVDTLAPTETQVQLSRRLEA